MQFTNRQSGRTKFNLKKISKTGNWEHELFLEITHSYCRQHSNVVRLIKITRPIVVMPASNKPQFEMLSNNPMQYQSVSMQYQSVFTDINALREQEMKTEFRHLINNNKQLV